jgi:flavin-dependent dehydrogenase
MKMGAFLATVLAAVALTHGVVAEYDVFVYGATPAGVLAAVAAVGEGRTVVLADPRAHIGGMVTGGLCVSDIGVTTAVLGGRTRAFFAAITAAYGGNSTGKLQYNFEPHVASSVLQDLFLIPAAAKLKLALNTRV